MQQAVPTAVPTALVQEGFDKLLKIKGVMWSWNDKMRKHVKEGGGSLPSNHVGVLAQDVEKQFPELIESSGGMPGSDEAIKYVDYQGLTGVATEAIKELAGRVAALEA